MCLRVVVNAEHVFLVHLLSLEACTGTFHHLSCYVFRTYVALQYVALTLPALSAAVGNAASGRRGLQLHLLSALGEIWRGGGLTLEGGPKKEFVGLSVVMKAKGREQPVGRRQLQDSGEYYLLGDDVT